MTQRGYNSLYYLLEDHKNSLEIHELLKNEFD